MAAKKKKSVAKSHALLISEAVNANDWAALDEVLVEVPLATLVSAVLHTRTLEARLRLARRLITQPPLLPLALAGFATDDPSVLQLEDESWKADVGGLTPAHLAVMCGAGRCLARMREAGLSVDSVRQVWMERHTPLSLCFLLENWMLAGQLVATGSVGDRLSGTLSAVGRVPEALLAPLVEAIGPGEVARAAFWYGDDLTPARLQALVGLGVPMSNAFVLDVLKSMNLSSGDDAARLKTLIALLAVTSLGDGTLVVANEHIDLVHVALKGSLERAEALREAGVPVRTVNVPAGWDDAKKKQAWVRKHAVLGAPFGEFITALGADVLGQVVETIAQPRGIGPLRLGMTKPEALAAVGRAPRWDSDTSLRFNPESPDGRDEGPSRVPWHELEIGLESGLVRSLTYTWDQAGPDTLHKPMKARLLTLHGAPEVDEKRLTRWSLDGGALELSVDDKKRWRLAAFRR